MRHRCTVCLDEWDDLPGIPRRCPTCDEVGTVVRTPDEEVDDPVPETEEEADDAELFPEIAVEEENEDLREFELPAEEIEEDE